MECVGPRKYELLLVVESCLLVVKSCLLGHIIFFIASNEKQRLASNKFYGFLFFFLNETKFWDIIL